MATIRIPTPLRRLTGNQAKVTVGGGTIAELVLALDKAYPGLKDRLVDETGGIKRFINVFVNGEEIRTLQGEATPVKDGDEVSIIPAMAGGYDFSLNCNLSLNFDEACFCYDHEPVMR